mmetsp:Transcript_118432/g.330366  ORF Transcript_118432/g.330366 Transcript_118432/m.330366 type:complete len:220 (+) Transcript_118432:1630-2289(+)
MRNLLEVRSAEPGKYLLPLGLYQVRLDLHDDVVSWHMGRNCLEHSTDAEIVHAGEAEIELRLVARALPASDFGLPEAAAGSPLQDLSVAQLHEVRIFLEEGVEPVERALVWDCHREHDLVLSILGLRRRHGHHIGLRGCLQHPTLEGQRLCWLWPKEHLHGHAAERHVGVERFAEEVVGQWLRLRDALTFAEEAHGVGVCTLRIQVQDHGNDLVPRKTL